jgi:hypothetical protein
MGRQSIFTVRRSRESGRRHSLEARWAGTPGQHVGTLQPNTALPPVLSFTDLGPFPRPPQRSTRQPWQFRWLDAVKFLLGYLELA